MTAVPPIGDEITDGTVPAPGLGRGTQVRQRVIMPANQRLPGRSARTDVKWNFGFRKLCGFALERMICLVAPIQGDDIVCSSGRQSALINLSRLTSSATGI